MMKNENQIKFQWVGNNKGSVALLEEKFPQKAQLLEDQRSRLTSYDSEATLGTSSVNEDNFFYNMLSGVDSDVTSEKV